MESFVTMITPYTADGQVDLAAAEKMVDWYFREGVDGIFAICQSSEIFWLSLEERTALNRVVYRHAKELEKTHGRAFPVISSGHVADSLEEQAEELNAVWKSGTDALILITNRLAGQNEGDDVFLNNLEKLMVRLPADAPLGLYECPYPYKRLLTPRILEWCASSGRFAYIKDTCCDAQEIKRRCELLNGRIGLYNANCQTLLESMRDGAAGYCGIMCNFHPALYAWLCRHTDDPRADTVQAVLGTFGFTEVGLPYPLTAKYHMNLCGISMPVASRNRKPEEWTPYAASCMKQMKLATDQLRKTLEGKA